MDSFALVGIGAVDMHPLSTIVVLPVQLILVADHVNSVHDQQPWLVSAPGGDLWMT